MNKLSLNSGSLNPDNDSIKINVAMDPGSKSSMIIRSFSGSGVINYLTESDYVYKVSREPYKGGDPRSVNPSLSSNMAYPDGVAFIPGGNVCANSSSEVIEENYRLPIGTYMHTGSQLGKVGITGDLLDDESNINDVHMAGFEGGNLISPAEIFESGWAISGGLKVGSLNSINDTLPFIDVENMDISSGQIARLDIYASELNGCFFEIEIENDITETGIPLDDYETMVTGDTSEINKKPEEILPFLMGGDSESRLIDEWNSLFKINDKCNIEDEFSNNKNRDQAFIDALRGFLDKNWDESMKQFLWGSAIHEKAVRDNITVKIGAALKTAIFYQLYYYGASDDIKTLSEHMEQKGRLGKTMAWHFGLGGISKLSGRSRKIKQEYTYLPSNRSYKKIYKIYDMPPRGAFSAVSESNEKMFDNMGSDFEEDPKVISGFYPLYSSENYSNTKGGGSSMPLVFNDKKYYMPSGLVSGSTYFHGDYDPKMLISYLNDQDFEYDVTGDEASDIYMEGYDTEVYEAVQEEQSEEVSGEYFDGSYNAETGNYAPVIGTDDPEVIQEYANQSFLIDFFNENGGI